MNDQTDYLLHVLVYEIRGCEHICDLRLQYQEQAMQMLKRKQESYEKKYGKTAVYKAQQYLNA